MSEPIIFNPNAQTLYEQIGGDPTFRRLVDAFYARVEQDPLLRPIFPDDLGAVLQLSRRPSTRNSYGAP